MSKDPKRPTLALAIGETVFWILLYRFPVLLIPLALAALVFAFIQK